MMIQPNIKELAKQGNPQAIATLINHSLKLKDITVKASLKGECLRVKLESSHVPEQQAMIQFIHQGMTKLRAESIKTVKVYGFKTGIDFPAWSQELELNSQTSHHRIDQLSQGQNTPKNFSEEARLKDLSDIKKTIVQRESVSTSSTPLSVNEQVTEKQPIINQKDLNLKAVIYGLLLDLVGTYAVLFFLGTLVGIVSALAGMTPQQIGESFHNSSYVLLQLAIGLSFTLLGGWLTAHIAGQSKIKHALVMGAASMAISIVLGFLLGRFQSLEWYDAVSLLLTIPAALLGGYLRQIFRKS